MNLKWWIAPFIGALIATDAQPVLAQEDESAGAVDDEGNSDDSDSGNSDPTTEETVTLDGHGCGLSSIELGSRQLEIKPLRRNHEAFRICRELLFIIGQSPDTIQLFEPKEKGSIGSPYAATIMLKGAPRPIIIIPTEFWSGLPKLPSAHKYAYMAHEIAHILDWLPATADREHRADIAAGRMLFQLREFEQDDVASAFGDTRFLVTTSIHGSPSQRATYASQGWDLAVLQTQARFVCQLENSPGVFLNALQRPSGGYRIEAWKDGKVVDFRAGQIRETKGAWKMTLIVDKKEISLKIVPTPKSGIYDVKTADISVGNCKDNSADVSTRGSSAPE